VLFVLSYALAYQLRLDHLTSEYAGILFITLPFVVLVKIGAYQYFGNYRSIWRYSSLSDLRDLWRGSIVSCLVLLAACFLVPTNPSIPRSVLIIDMIVSFLLTGGVRMTVRIFYEVPDLPRGARALRTALLSKASLPQANRVLVVGAGDAGEMIVREMIRSSRLKYDPVAFVDDNPAKLGQSIHGVTVQGTRKDIPALLEKHAAREILIAIPSAPGRIVGEIIEICRDTPAALKILPDMSKIVNGSVQVSDIRQVEIEDLLGREQVELDVFLISSYLRRKRVLITGAGGSIGSELCRQILRFGPREVQLMGRGENSIFEIHSELSKMAGFTRLVQIIGDVINKRKLEGIFAMYRPHIVFHAGADKHVPLMEMNPDEAVLNNIVGTYNVLQVANAHNVERVVCISTDKAVNPTSVMGCCKRVAELLVRSSLFPQTVPVAVRFGNVLGSRGSVIPHFQKQIRSGGPVTVTHRDISRFFMTIPEAAGLVIQAGAMGHGGEVFVLDMGEPVKIWDLAESMIRLAGLEPGRDIEMHEIGLRPGEKLYEELHFEKEERDPTSHRKISCVRGGEIDEVAVLDGIKRLTERAVRMDYAGIREELRKIVPEYRPRDEGEDVLLWAGGEEK
jgi:FlaA1/EpsC-like NDP-sugar epimerase